jgi:hypothetical protein
MRISTTHLHALLHVKKMIEQIKAMKRLPLTDREREVLGESLERAYDRAAFLLTPQVMQALADEEEEMTMEGEDDDVSRVCFS